MSNSLLYKLRSGKNSKLGYYLRNYFGLILPKSLFRQRLESALFEASRRDDYDYILERVNYYNRMSHPAELPDDTMLLANHKVGGQKVYFFDSYEYTRYFPASFRMGFCPGDVTYVPEIPSIVKSRPLCEDNANSVVLKLDKVRHFLFVDDSKPFAEKLDKVVFRGKVEGKESRRQFMKMYFNDPDCNLGNVSRNSTDPAEWQTGKMTIREHLDYKFIMALEGNDVASNLKWVMSSNSLAVMPRPTCETWFMEGRLKPDVHYVEINSDFSNLKEKMRYYATHHDEAQRIIENAHKYVSQFFDKRREDLISILVLEKYFELTEQSNRCIFK